MRQPDNQVCIAPGTKRGEYVDREREGRVNGLELALELVPVPGSKVGLEVREANGRQEILGDLAHVPLGIHLDRRIRAHERLAQRTQGHGSGSRRSRTG